MHSTARSRFVTAFVLVLRLLNEIPLLGNPLQLHSNTIHLTRIPDSNFVILISLRVSTQAHLHMRAETRQISLVEVPCAVIVHQKSSLGDTDLSFKTWSLFLGIFAALENQVESLASGLAVWRVAELNGLIVLRTLHHIVKGIKLTLFLDQMVKSTVESSISKRVLE